MIIAFERGKQVGYLEGDTAKANAEYLHGLIDGTENCIRMVFGDKSKKAVNTKPNTYEETL